MNIVLVGFKSCGKTTLGKSLAKHLAMQFIDTDLRLESLHHALTKKKEGCRTIYQDYGREYFRYLETMSLASFLWSDNAVVSTGGGAVLSDANCKLLSKAGLCIFIDTSLELIKKRLADVTTPLFQGQSLEEIYKERRELYLAIADINFAVNEEKTPEKLAEELSTLISNTQREQENV